MGSPKGTRRAVVATNVLAIVLLVLFLAADVSDVIAYLRSPSEYHIGAEPMGFRYRSEAHFMAIALGQMGIALLGLLGPHFVANSPDSSPWARPLLRTAAVAALFVCAAVQLSSIG